MNIKSFFILLLLNSFAFADDAPFCSSGALFDIDIPYHDFESDKSLYSKSGTKVPDDNGGCGATTYTTVYDENAWKDSNFGRGSSYTANNSFYAYGWDRGKLTKEINILDLGAKYQLKFMGAYSVKKNGSSDSSNNTYNNQKVTAKFNHGSNNTQKVDHWIFDDKKLMDYTLNLGEPNTSTTKLTLEAYAGNGNSFIKVDNFRLQKCITGCVEGPNIYQSPAIVYTPGDYSSYYPRPYTLSPKLIPILTGRAYKFTFKISLTGKNWDRGPMNGRVYMAYYDSAGQFISKGLTTVTRTINKVYTAEIDKAPTNAKYLKVIPNYKISAQYTFYRITSPKLVINCKETPLTITPKNNSFTEGSEYKKDRTHTVKLKLSRALTSSDIGGSSATLNYKLQDGTAVGDKKDAIGLKDSDDCPCKKRDYIPASKNITIKEGDKEINIPVQISEDGFFENDEDFYIKLSLPNSKHDSLNDKYKVTIKNDDVLRVGIRAGIANENEKTIDFHVGANAIIPKGHGDVKIYYKTEEILNMEKDLKATSNLDYVHTDESFVIIKEGEVKTYIKIPLKDDDIGEKVENFQVILTKAENIAIYDPENTAYGSIEDDDYNVKSKASYSIHDPSLSVIQTKVVNQSYNIKIKAAAGLQIPFIKKYYSCSSCSGCSLSRTDTGFRYKGKDNGGRDLYVQNSILSDTFYVKNIQDITPKYIVTDKENVNLAGDCGGGCGSSGGGSTNSGGGSSCASCSPPCYYWSSVSYEYSSKMTISKATLEGYSGYNASKKQCTGSVEFIPIDISAIQNISSSEEKILSFTPKKAYRCARIKVEGRSDTDYTKNKSTSIAFDAYSDLFSTRPSKFIITDKKTDTTESLYSTTNPIKAGHPIQLYIKALGTGNTNIAGYSDDINKIYSIKDAIYPTVTEHGFNYNNYSGALDLTYSTYDAKTTYLEAGDLTITLKEDRNTPYAQVDKDDGTPASMLYIPTYTKRFRVIPDRFDISYTSGEYADNTNNITLIASSTELDAMHSYVKVSLKAVELGGLTTTRYEKIGALGYAYDTDLTIKNKIVTSNSGSQELNLKRVSKPDSKQTSISTSANTTFAIGKEEFIKGEIKNNKILMNFTRAKNTPLEPIQLFTNGFDIKETNGITSHLVSGTNSIKSNKKFYYGRVHAPSPQSTEGKNLAAKLYYEIYCKSCDKTLFPLANNKASIDSVYWYILKPTIYNSLGGQCQYTFSRFASNTTIDAHSKDSSNPTSIYNIKAKTTPISNRMYYKAPEFLLYNKYNSATSEHSFDIKFTSASAKWAGEGKQGQTVDTEVSKITNQSIEW